MNYKIVRQSGCRPACKLFVSVLLKLLKRNIVNLRQVILLLPIIL